MDASKRLNWTYIVIQGLYFLTNASFGAFGTIFMLDRGLTESQVGLILSTGNVLALILQPLTVRLYESFPRLTVKKTIGTYGLLILALTLLMMVFKQPLITAVLFALAWALIIALVPLLNSIFVTYRNLGYAIDFSKPRAMGSLAYSLTAFFLGNILQNFGHHWLLIIVALAYVFFLLAVGQLPESKPLAGRVEDSPEEAKAYLEEDEESRQHFKWLLLGIGLFMIFHNMVTTYMIHIVEPLGGGESQVGLASAIAAAVEIPVLLAYNKVAQRFSHRQLLMLSGFGFVLKVLVTSLSPNIAGIYFAQFLQIIAFALYLISGVEYTNQILKPKDAVRGQTYLTMASTLGGILGNVVGGVLIEYFSLQHFYVFGLSSSILGLFFFYLGLRRDDRKIFSR